MTELIFDLDGQVAEYVGDRLGLVFHPPFVAIGFARDGKVQGGAIFNDYNGSNIEVSFYAPRFQRGIGRALLHYAFIQAGCNRLSAHTRPTNDQAIKLFHKLGFVLEALRPRYFRDGGDALLFRLDREIALKRWLKVT